MKWGAYYRQGKDLVYKNRRKMVGTFTREQWETLCSFFDGICPRCKKAVKCFTVDHIKPVSLGGTNTIENLQPLCGKCNSSKNNIYQTDYRTKEVKEWAEEETRRMMENELS